MSNLSELLLKQNTVFSYSDLAAIWNVQNKSTLARRVDYLIKTKKIIRLKKGLFYIEGREYNKYELANKLRPISYVSFETVLVRSGFIYQVYDSIFSASNLTRTYIVDNKKYIYKRLKEDILLDSTGISKIDNLYYMANPCRALLDTVYLNKDYPIDNLNLNSFNFKEAYEMVLIYENKTLSKELVKLEKLFT